MDRGILKYDVLQIDRGSGSGWLDFSTIRDEDDVRYALQLVAQDPYRLSMHGLKAGEAAFRVYRWGTGVIA